MRRDEHWRIRCEYFLNGLTNSFLIGSFVLTFDYSWTWASLSFTLSCSEYVILLNSKFHWNLDSIACPNNLFSPVCMVFIKSLKNGFEDWSSIQFSRFHSPRLIFKRENKRTKLCVVAFSQLLQHNPLYKVSSWWKLQFYLCLCIYFAF